MKKVEALTDKPVVLKTPGDHIGCNTVRTAYMHPASAVLLHTKAGHCLPVVGRRRTDIEASFEVILIPGHTLAACD